MVEVVILSAVKRQCIQSAQPLKWVFLPPFASLYQLCKCSSEQETRTKVINSEGRARRQEDEEGAAPLTIQGHSYLHKQLTGTLANPVRNRLDNDLDNKAIHCCRERSKQHITLVPRLIPSFCSLLHSCVGAGLYMIRCKVASLSQSIRRTDGGPSKGLTQGWGETRKKQKLLPQRSGSSSLGLHYPLW